MYGDRVEASSGMSFHHCQSGWSAAGVCHAQSVVYKWRVDKLWWCVCDTNFSMKMFSRPHSQVHATVIRW
jgi:hypothetical protein